MKRNRSWLRTRGAAAWAAAPLVAVVLGACGAEEPGAPRAGGTDSSAADSRTRSSEPDRPRERSRTGRVARPVELELPSIGVRAPVIPLGLNRDKTLEVPEDYGDTGWWTGGPEPGERGPAVIAGHVDSEDGPAVFYRLEQLEGGDEIVVRRRDGSRVRFTVTRMERHPKDDFPTEAVYGSTPEPELRLITCSGDFDSAAGHYVDNTIVFARLA